MDSYDFFLNETTTPETYTLSLHDALPIYRGQGPPDVDAGDPGRAPRGAREPMRRRRGRRLHAGPRPDRRRAVQPGRRRSEEHTSELQSRRDLVCRLLLEKKKKHNSATTYT